MAQQHVFFDKKEKMIPKKGVFMIFFKMKTFFFAGWGDQTLKPINKTHSSQVKFHSRTSVFKHKFLQKGVASFDFCHAGNQNGVTLPETNSKSS